MYYSLGIDTSNYTTAVAVVDNNKQMIYQDRRLLEVPCGARGLQQSQAVFQHVKNLPELLCRAFGTVNRENIAVVSASTAPRSAPGSYMPVFQVSGGQGRVVAAALAVPFHGTTHQEGHIEAAAWSCGTELPGRFLAVHLSGGTSELLLVERLQGGYRVKLLGGSTDLHAGQLVDRVGVALGLAFPCGPALEMLAQKGGRSLGIATSVKGYHFSFSGPESQARRLIDGGAAAGDVARSVEHCIATTLEKVLRRAVEKLGIKTVLIAGGVAANAYVRARLRQRLEHPAAGGRLYFAEPQYATDNAAGVALLGVKFLSGQQHPLM